MTDVEFEKLLSTDPVSNHEGFKIRDLIFEYYLARFTGDYDEANKKTKEYTDELYKRFVKS